MHSLRSAAVQYTNYGTGGAFELPTQSGTYTYIYHFDTSDQWKLQGYISHIALTTGKYLDIALWLGHIAL